MCLESTPDLLKPTHVFDLTFLALNQFSGEISNLSLYEKGASQQLYHGQAGMSVQVVDVRKPSESPLPKQVSFVYPDRGPIQVDDMPPMEFRQKFLGYLAWRLARNWTAVPIRETYYEDDEQK